MAARDTLAMYYWLTKPGIVYGNLISAAAGFLLAAQGDVDFGLLLAFMAGTALVIASGCVINNVIDRGIDRHMARTKKRALAGGELAAAPAITYGAALAVIGFALLVLFTNWLTVALGALGYFFYLVMYSVWKRRSVYGTMVGSVSGATPIAAGYTAAAGQFDGAAALLFLILVCWQMPHFYAIALFRREEYAAAKLPVLPVVKGLRATQRQILAFVILFVAATLLLAVLGYTGFVYTLVVGLAGLWWLYKAMQGFGARDSARWARGMFGASLLVLLVFCAMIAVDWLLP
jgi:protoheme IX farnesyltransferase